MIIVKKTRGKRRGIDGDRGGEELQGAGKDNPLVYCG